MIRFLGLVLALAVSPALAAEKLTGEQIREAFNGNTVAGQYAHGGHFSEYHAADGRALGDNGFSFNVDACWNVDGDAVCYHYGPAKERKTYCFEVEREGDSYRLTVRGNGRLNAIARIEKGNPASHDDAGRRWSCDDLLAGALLLRRFARRGP